MVQNELTMLVGSWSQTSNTKMALPKVEMPCILHRDEPTSIGAAQRALSRRLHQLRLELSAALDGWFVLRAQSRDTTRRTRCALLARGPIPVRSPTARRSNQRRWRGAKG